MICICGQMIYSGTLKYLISTLIVNKGTEILQKVEKK